MFYTLDKRPLGYIPDYPWFERAIRELHARIEFNRRYERFPDAGGNFSLPATSPFPVNRAEPKTPSEPAEAIAYALSALEIAIESWPIRADEGAVALNRSELALEALLLLKSMILAGMRENEAADRARFERLLGELNINDEES